jgi:hypothetical protein
VRSASIFFSERGIFFQIASPQKRRWPRPLVSPSCSRGVVYVAFLVCCCCEYGGRLVRIIRHIGASSCGITRGRKSRLIPSQSLMKSEISCSEFRERAFSVVKTTHTLFKPTMRLTWSWHIGPILNIVRGSTLVCLKDEGAHNRRAPAAANNLALRAYHCTTWLPRPVGLVSHAQRPNAPAWALRVPALHVDSVSCHAPYSYTRVKP